MDDKNAPLYSFTYRPSYGDIRRFGRRLLSRPIWNIRIWICIWCVLSIFSLLSLLADFFDNGFLRFFETVHIFYWQYLLPVDMAAFIMGWIAISKERHAREYETERIAEVDFISTYTFYTDRVEAEGPKGHRSHAYTVYDELVLYPEIFYLRISDYQGEHLPWTVVPENQREAFRDFLVGRAREYGVPVNDRGQKRKRRY